VSPLERKGDGVQVLAVRVVSHRVDEREGGGVNRRGFLQAMLATGCAPAIVKAANIMPIFARSSSGLLVPEEAIYEGSAVNFVLMRELLRSARELPYFSGEPLSVFDLPMSSDRLRFTHLGLAVAA
jgi:hypothetical protein